MGMSHAKSASGERSALRPLKDVFGALAEELEHARVLGLRVEQTICAIAVRSHLDAGIVGELQQLDAVLQRIAAVRDFASTLSSESGRKDEIDIRGALDRITLNETRARLAGAANEDDESAWEFL